MLVKRYTNNNAKNYFNKVLKNQLVQEQIDIYNKKVIYSWLTEFDDIKCYILSKENKIINIILCSKMDFDPLNKHSSPYTLNFIYTFKEFRRKNYACKMLEYIKSKEEIGQATCNGVESTNLFKKANYISARVPLAEHWAEEILGPGCGEILVDIYRFP